MAPVLTASLLKPLKPIVAKSPSTTRPKRCKLVVRAHGAADAHDEDIIPILGRVKKDFTDKELEEMKHPHLLGGKTIGEELSLIRKQYVKAEEKALHREDELFSSNWAGDVYIGGRWNTLSVLYLVFMMTPLAGLVFAYVTYGTLWATGEYVPPPIYL